MADAFVAPPTDGQSVVRTTKLRPTASGEIRRLPSLVDGGDTEGDSVRAADDQTHLPRDNSSGAA